tara:strand:- start:125 stop:526 length:402 start_codon:yes stop_codon:yes gene_type:complete
MNSNEMNSLRIQSILNLDEKLSKRFIKLDPKGYFLIKVDSTKGEIVVEHFSNDLDETGLALDPETGEPIKCSGDKKRDPIGIIRGKSAKEIGIKLTEDLETSLISKLDHALYLGRELQKAEGCLIRGEKYIQD